MALSFWNNNLAQYIQRIFISMLYIVLSSTKPKVNWTTLINANLLWPKEASSCTNMPALRWCPSARRWQVKTEWREVISGHWASLTNRLAFGWSGVWEHWHDWLHSDEWVRERVFCAHVDTPTQSPKWLLDISLRCPTVTNFFSSLCFSLISFPPTHHSLFFIAFVRPHETTAPHSASAKTIPSSHTHTRI